jgi:magnesium transporter
MLNYYYKTIKSGKIEKIEKHRAGVWINVVEPSVEEIKFLVEKYELEEDLLMDALDENEVPRLEVESKVVYLFNRVPEKKGKEIITEPLLLVLGNDYLLTIARKELEFMENFITGKKDIVTTQKIKTFLQIFSAVNYRYNKYLNEINRDIRFALFRLERISTQDIIKFVNFEKVLNDFLSALIPMKTSLEKLLDGRSLRLYEEDKDLIEDLFLSTGQLVEMAKSTLRHITNIRDAYSNIMNHELNRTMKLLTVLTIILTVPTIVFSFFGMNVNFPFGNSPETVWQIIIFTLLFLSGLSFLFLRNRWLK